MALDLIRNRYHDFGPTLACEKLREIYGLYLSKETVRKLMAEAGLWMPRKPRSARVYQPRNKLRLLGPFLYPLAWRSPSQGYGRQGSRDLSFDVGQYWDLINIVTCLILIDFFRKNVCSLCRLRCGWNVVR